MPRRKSMSSSDAEISALKDKISGNSPIGGEAKN